MFKKSDVISRLIFVLFAAILFLMVLGGRLFTNIEEDVYVSEEENRIVVGVSSWEVSPAGGRPIRSLYRTHLRRRTDIF